MFRNHLKTAWRHIRKESFYSAIHILGLAIGLCSFAFILLWTTNEKSFDRFHKKTDRIYRLVTDIKTDRESFAQATTPPPLAPLLAREIPEIEAQVRMDNRDAIIRKGREQFYEDAILFTEPSFFNIFDFQLLQGDVRSCLYDPYSIVLTESTAQRFFGLEDPIGQSLTMLLYDPDNDGMPYTVTGIVEDPPINSHLQFKILGALSTAKSVIPEFERDWQGNDLYSYALLRDGVRPAAVAEKLTTFVKQRLDPSHSDQNSIAQLSLQPIGDIHLKSAMRSEISQNGDARYVYLFSSIGWLILLMAAINYINLSTAHSLGRIEEIGLRKVLGAGQLHLMTQVVLEAVLVSLCALLVSFLFIELAKPLFNLLAGFNLMEIPSLNIWWVLTVTAILLGLASGFYPALYISRLGSTTNRKTPGQFNPLLRKGLVIIQFTICTAMVIGLVVIQLQMRYIQNKNLGFATSAKVLLKVNGSQEVRDNFVGFRNELLAESTVTGVATSNSTPVGHQDNATAQTTNERGLQTSHQVAELKVSPEFFDLYRLTLRAGQGLSPQSPADSTTEFIVNEAAITTFGWKNPEAAIGRPFSVGGQSGTIRGVIANFHFNSLKSRVEPLVISSDAGRFSQITVGLTPEDLGDGLQNVQRMWDRHFPNSFLEYHFLNARLAAQYRKEQQMGQLFVVFFGLALFIALFGLLGLASYAAEMRTKEIGIRKVLGASVVGIMALMSKDFLKLVGIALVIAGPIGWYFTQEWLQGFAYRIRIQWWFFALAGLITGLSAFLTVSIQSIRVAMTDPVKSLRSE